MTRDASTEETRGPRGEGRLQIVPLTRQAEHRWDRFVLQHPEGRIGHTAGWTRAIERSLGHEARPLLARDSEGAIQGIAPLFVRRPPLLAPDVVSVPAANEGGILAASGEAGEALLEAAREVAREVGARLLELRGGWTGGMTQRVANATVRLDLPDSPDDLMALHNRAVRRRLREALARDVQFLWGAEHLDTFYRLYLAAMHRLGSPPFALGFFERLAGECAPHIRVLICRVGGQPIGADLLAVFGGVASSLYAGSDPAARSLHPDHLTLHEAMRRAIQEGCRAFDLGRSPLGSGALAFKQQWGGETIPLPHAYDPSAAAPKERPGGGHPPALSLASQLWRRLPAPLAHRFGPPLIRFIH